MKKLTLLFSGLLFIAVAQSQSWQVISTEGTMNEIVHLISSPDGQVYAAARNEALSYTVFRLNNGSWAMINGGGGADLREIVTDRNGALYSNSISYTQMWNGTTWDYVFSPFSTPTGLGLCFDTNNVAYSIRNDANPFPNVQKWDNGWQFLDATGYTTNPDVNSVKLVIGAHNRPYIAYQDYKCSQPCPDSNLVVVKMFDGTGWVELPAPPVFGTEATPISLQCGLNDTLYLAYYTKDYATDRTRQLVMKFTGAAWQPVGTINLTDPILQLAISKQGTPYALLQTSLPANATAIWYDGTDWRITGQRDFGQQHLLAVDTADNLYTAGFSGLSQTLMPVPPAYGIYPCTPSATSICPGAQLLINYTTTGTFYIENVFTAQLSDQFGNFGNNNTVVGFIQSNTSGTIAVQIPVDLPTPEGARYKIRVVADDGSCLGTYFFTIGGLQPQVTIAANQPDTICRGTNITYTATPVNGGATPNYTWLLNGNVVQNGPSDTYRFLTTPTRLSNLQKNHTVKCVITANTGCATGTDTSNIKNIAIQEKPLRTAITGKTRGVCGGAIETYTCFSSPGATYYTWTCDSGQILSGQGTTSVSIQFKADFITGNISVVAGNNCGISNAATSLVKCSLFKTGEETGIEEEDETTLVNVYPNPTVDGWQLTVDSKYIGSTVEVFDVNGKLVWKSEIREQTSEITISASAGMYLLRIANDKGSVVKRLVKM